MSRLITIGTPAVLAFIAIVLFVMKAEYKDWGRRLAKALIGIACSTMPEPERSRLHEEWTAELAAVWTETEKECTGLTFACFLAARYGTLGWGRRLWRMVSRDLDLVSGSLVAVTFFRSSPWLVVPISMAFTLVGGVIRLRLARSSNPTDEEDCPN